MEHCRDEVCITQPGIRVLPNKVLKVPFNSTIVKTTRSPVGILTISIGISCRGYAILEILEIWNSNTN